MDHRRLLARAVGVVFAASLVAGCAGGGPVAAPTPDAPSPSGTSAAPSPPPSEPPQPSGPSGPTASSAPPAAAPVTGGDRRVLAISVDGLNPDALSVLGRRGSPYLHRLVAEGASTLNARTELEQTVTLPNHTGMLTGRRIEAARGGHGVTWNDDRAGTVQQAAGHPVASVFTTVHRAGGGTALFAAKEKFAIFDRSWGRAIDEFRADTDNTALVGAARRDLLEERRAFTFLHLSLPDVTGHAHGFMSRAYLRAVRRTDELLGSLVRAIDSEADLRDHLVVVLTADHGGLGAGHSDRTVRANYRVPFVVWGAGIAPGDLYALNPDYRDPGRGLPTYRGRQPVRNGDVANLSADLLGLPAVAGSELDREQDLDVTVD